MARQMDDWQRYERLRIMAEGRLGYDEEKLTRS
jgi:hypothetical protein